MSADRPMKVSEPMSAGEPASDRLCDAIRALRIELGILNDRVAMAAGLHPRDLDILDVIDRDGACTPKHLAARTGVRAATLTGVLARLERDGWVAREAHPGDARSWLLRSTERFDELRRLYADADRRVADLRTRLDPAAYDLLIPALTQLADGARRAAERVDP